MNTRRIITVLACLVAWPSLACEAVVSPAWYVLDKNNNPVAIRVFETSGHTDLDVVFEANGKHVSLQIPGAKKGYTWAYGTCAPNKKPDQSIFSMVKVPVEDGWAPAIVSAYRVNLVRGSLDPIPSANLYCFAPSV